MFLFCSIVSFPFHKYFHKVVLLFAKLLLSTTTTTTRDSYRSIFFSDVKIYAVSCSILIINDKNNAIIMCGAMMVVLNIL